MKRRLWLPILIALAGSACAKPNLDEVPPTGSPVHVEVENRFGQSVEISALGAGTSYRLGVVHPGMRAHFVIPQNLVSAGSVELAATPGTTGTRNQVYRSGALLVSPGKVIDLLVAAVLFNSKTSIRP